MSTDDFISLDWRESPTRNTIIDRILKLLADVDALHEGMLTLSQSNARGAIVLHEDGDGVATIRRRNNPTLRKINTAINRLYYYQLFILAKTFVGMQSQSYPLKARFIAYKDVQPKYSMSLVKARRLMLDLALTINVHPSALGIIGEEDGQVSVLKLVTIEVTRVTNAIAYNDRDKDPNQDFKTVAKLTPGIYKIPDLVLSLQVATRKQRKVAGKIDAVVVVEHRNLSEVLLRENLAVEDIIVVMTAGFPDSGTKEFLHLLSKEKKTKNLLFLYLGDHDPAGYSIFQCLKYGSRTSAWVTPISVCPQLRYVGPTLEDLKDSAKLFRTTWEKQHRADHVRATDAEVNRAADKWQATAEKLIKAKLTDFTKKDKETFRSFDKLGWLVREDLIRQEIAAMEQGKGTVSQPAVISGSPATREFRGASSQSQSQGISQSLTGVPQGNVVSNSPADDAVPLDTNDTELVAASDEVHLVQDSRLSLSIAQGDPAGKRPGEPQQGPPSKRATRSGDSGQPSKNLQPL
ncbi:MAG: hypothetical protein Q9181_004130 [Wetmoreana brouardii]